MSPVSTQLKLPNKPGWEVPTCEQHELQQACSPPLHDRTWTWWDFLHLPTFHLNYFFSLSILLSSLLLCVFHSSYQLSIQWGIWLIKRLASRSVTALCSGTEHVSPIHASFFFVEKLICWNMRKQNKQSSKKLTVNTSTTKFLTTETGAAQNPAEWVRLGRVRAAEVQKLSLFNTLPYHYTCQL